MKPLYSGHHRDREKVSAIGRCPLQGGVRYIEVNLEGFLRIGSQIVSAIERFAVLTKRKLIFLPSLLVDGAQ